MRIPLKIGTSVICLNQNGMAQNLEDALLAGLPVVVVKTV